MMAIYYRQGISVGGDSNYLSTFVAWGSVATCKALMLALVSPASEVWDWERGLIMDAREKTLTNIADHGPDKRPVR